MIEVHLLKDRILGTFIGHETSALHNAIIIFLGIAMRLALRRPVLHKLLCIQLAPMHLRTGKGPAGTFNADGPLKDFKTRSGIYHLPYKADVAVGQGLARPEPDYKVLHG